MVSQVDLGLLYEICQEALQKYQWIPVRGLLREYNARCPSGHCRGYLNGAMLRSAMTLVDGEVLYRGDGVPRGIGRRVQKVSEKIPMPF